MSADMYIVRVTYKNENVELHEFKNKHKAMHARDKFRAMENVESAKLLTADEPF